MPHWLVTPPAGFSFWGFRGGGGKCRRNDCRNVSFGLRAA
jgi:hypothetical protein